MRVLAVLVLGAALSAHVAAQEPQRIVEIRVHGNHTTPEPDILAMSGLGVGEDPSDLRLREAERTLRRTARFEAVEIHRRFLSIADPSQILVMIIVNEHPAVSSADLTPGPFKKFASTGMWLPILRHDDGYGLTYGVRYGRDDLLGERSRVAVPLSWGGERRAGLETERLLDGPIHIVRGSLSLYRRVNPHFELTDTRTEIRVEAERTVTRWLRFGGGARTADVGFGESYEARHTAGHAYIVLDTRIDPSFPRDALYLRLGWERLAFQTDRASIWRADIRGYVGLAGSTVLALRGQFATSDTTLPSAERNLLGGSSSLRGYRTGDLAGDNLTAATVEVRQPLNSPLTVARLGVKAFVDLGTAWAAGERLERQRFERGIGAGIYAGAGPFIVDLDLAWPTRGGARAHFGLGVTF
jgi:outer membrane protein assembly factor BamA